MTWCPPMRPAIWVPLKTRAGVAQAPIDPGDAVLLVVAVGGTLALEVVALHGAGEALALGDGDGVDPLAGAQEVGGELLADLVARWRRRAGARRGAARAPRRPRRSDPARACSASRRAGPPRSPAGRSSPRARASSPARRARARPCRTVTGMARLLVVPDLGHADLLADDRLGRHGWVPSVLVLERPQRRGTPGSSAPSPAPGSHANAPPGSPERSVRQVLPRGPHRTGRKALGDVESAYGPEISPTWDITPLVPGPARRNTSPERWCRHPPRGGRLRGIWVLILRSDRHPCQRCQRCQRCTVTSSCRPG